MFWGPKLFSDIGPNISNCAPDLRTAEVLSPGRFSNFHELKGCGFVFIYHDRIVFPGNNLLFSILTINIYKVFINSTFPNKHIACIVKPLHLTVSAHPTSTPYGHCNTCNTVEFNSTAPDPNGPKQCIS